MKKDKNLFRFDYITLFLITILIFSLIPESISASNNNNNNKKKHQHHKKQYKKDNSVIIIDNSNFEKIISSMDILILFYKSDDKNCQQFLPTYTEASLKLKKYKRNMLFGKIECNENSKTCDKQNLQRIPTIKYFKKGKSYLYFGTSDIQGILKFMWKNTLPPVSDLMTLAEISDFKNTHEISVIYFGKDKDIIKTLNDHALDDSDVFYAKTDFEKAYEMFNVKKNTIILYKKYGEDRTEMSGKLSKDGIINFIKKNSVDLILEGTERTVKLIWGMQQPGLFLFIDRKDLNSNFLIRVFNEVAEKIGNRIKIVIMGIESPMEQKINAMTMVKPQDLPTIRIYDPSKGPTTFYLFNKRIPMNTTNIIDFAEKFLKGRLQYYKLSEEIPKVQRGYMREIVAITFDKEIFYNHQHVLVLFYHPYKAPLFQTSIDFMENFARKLKDKEVEVYCNKMKDKEGKDINKKVLINWKINVGMLDLSRNDPDLHTINYGELPCVQLFLDEDKNHPIRFEGELTDENLVKFMENYFIDKEKEKKYEKENEKENQKEKINEEKQDL